MGVECEYDITVAGRSVDMRTTIDGLPIRGRRLDPGDPHAVRTLSGGVITADGPQAETASSPVRSGVGAVDALAAQQRAGAEELRAALGEGAVLTGFSTHLNVQIRDRVAPAAAHRLCERAAAPLMLLTMHPGSPGLLIRPRWRRMEIGCEFLVPHQMAVALPMVWAVTRLAERRRGLADVVPRTAPTVAPSAQRFGWYIDRSAFGPDLLADGRAAVLPTHEGGTALAGELLARLWAAVSTAITGEFGQEVANRVAAVVSGDEPLPCEEGMVADRYPPTAAPEPVDLECLRFGSLTLRPSVLTWRTAVFEVCGPSGSRWLSIPGEQCHSFGRAVVARDRAGETGPNEWRALRRVAVSLESR